MIINQVTKLSKKEFLDIKSNYINYLKDYNILYIDGKVIQEANDYIMYFKEVYNFPKHYGNNLDAFADWMSELDTFDEQGFIIIYNYHNFLMGCEDKKNQFTKIMSRIAFYLEKECLTTSGGLNHLKSFDVYLIDEDINV